MAQKESVEFVSPHRAHLSTQAQLHPTAHKLHQWTPQDRQPARQNDVNQDGMTEKYVKMEEHGQNLQDQMHEEKIGNFLPEKAFTVLLLN